MGAVGGGLWHLIRGVKNSPSGARMLGGVEVLSCPCISTKSSATLLGDDNDIQAASLSLSVWLKG